MGLPFLLSISKRTTSALYVVQVRRLLFTSTRIRRIDGSFLFQVRVKSNQAFHPREYFSPLNPQELAPKKQYPILGVNYLPGADGKGFPESLAVPRQDLPIAFQIQHADHLSIREWAQHCRKLLDEKLPKYGVVLFRGLPLSNGEHFSLFARSLAYTPVEYKAGFAYRPAYDEDARTYLASVEHKANNIEIHNEMAHWPHYPQKIIFYCDVPSPEGCGGLTPITRNSEVLEKLDAEVVRKFDEKQVRYYRYLPSEGKGDFPWQSVFRTNDRKAIEKYLDSVGAFYKWNPNDSLVYWNSLPAIIPHPRTGERVWFNQADTFHCTYFKYSPMFDGVTLESDFHYPTHTTYGDGTDIEEEVLQHIRAVKWQCSVGVEWNKSDLMVFDNLMAMHGRLSYTGERRLLVYMSSDI